MTMPAAILNYWLFAFFDVTVCLKSLPFTSWKMHVLQQSNARIGLEESNNVFIFSEECLCNYG